MKKTITAIISVLTIALLLCSCGSGGYASDNAPKESYDEYALYDTPTTEMSENENDYNSGAGNTAESGLSDFAPANQKLVYTTNLLIETKEFDTSYDAIMQALSDAAGYIEFKEIRGGYSGYNDYYSSRSAYMTLKIPSNNYESFLAKGEDFGNITRQNDSCDNITAQYVDTESRLAVLVAQRDQLLELMDRATSMEDIITIQTSLTQVVYEIESATAQIRTYDNMVDYCTVTISLDEVVSTSTSKTLTFGDRLASSLGDSFRVALEFLQGLVIALIYVLPYAIVGTGLFFLIRALVRKKRAKRLAEMQKAQDNGFSTPFAQTNEADAKTKKK
ncbi:MAG: DUF4349 domain-containing protein [Ruminococcaceae bacterium]|nr:DUF4349 domain-containing protein [Oscillospiraceae bacterium]